MRNWSGPTGVAGVIGGGGEGRLLMRSDRVPRERWKRLSQDLRVEQ